MLSKLYPHPFDEFISFEERRHIYTYIPLGMELPSVTTIIHRYFPKFDANNVISKMMNSPKWPKSPYYGMTREAIKQQWEVNRKEAAEAGTGMHKSIEDYFNNKLQVVPNTYEFGLFLDFWSKFSQTNEKFKPYRTEWIVYSVSLNIAGSIDFVLSNDSGDLILMDWKRSKEIKHSNRFQKGLSPIESLDDCNYNHYCLQLNTYRYIIEREYNKNVLAMFIVVFHPNLSECNFINVVRDDTHVTRIFSDHISKRAQNSLVISINS